MSGSAMDLPPLAYVVAHRKPGRHGMVRRLIDAKADLDVADSADRTVLVNAIEHNDTKLFQLLLERGASPHLPSECARRLSPLHAVFSSKSKHVNIDMLQTLIDLGCSVQACDSENVPVLRYAIQNGEDIPVSLVMRALNWHLHPPDSLKPRRPSSHLPTLGAGESKQSVTAADLSRLPPPDIPSTLSNVTPSVASLAGAVDRRPVLSDSAGEIEAGAGAGGFHGRRSLDMEVAPPAVSQDAQAQSSGLQAAGHTLRGDVSSFALPKPCTTLEIQPHVVKYGQLHHGPQTQPLAQPIPEPSSPEGIDLVLQPPPSPNHRRADHRPSSDYLGNDDHVDTPDSRPPQRSEPLPQQVLPQPQMSTPPRKRSKPPASSPVMFSPQRASVAANGGNMLSPLMI
eukprot:CAMPEP_0119333536 /NCGR_PEP_ID=MMETSP1333-20130426/85364_1 /TAXON_ID=418940 /ORGANISM="Scyphosphaera apsteinii, Strain RCC1455" /LENGTH=397 /DNA_ID=CAMNT_0007343627 /DNA_START=359 /DNA_END=1552 /DNA_ORIENTATION=-